MSDKIKILKAFIKNGRSMIDIAKASKIGYSTLDDVLKKRIKLTIKTYDKLYKGLNKLITKDIKLLEDFSIKEGLENQEKSLDFKG